MFCLVDCNNFFVSCERVFNRRLEGRPVAVLSNNDGCVVARSPEFKALGIPMGTPYFKLRPVERLYGLVFLSSNYELYADMSRRVMSLLREATPHMEQYSIDEAFLQMEFANDTAAQAFAQDLREKIRRWTGLPVGIGIAETKTLAKVASKLAKSSGKGVYVMPEDPAESLREFPLEDVWGVGSRLCRRLHYQGLDTALQLARQDALAVRHQYGVCLARTVMELNGHSAIDLEEAEPPRKSICYSKAFGMPITTLTDLTEAFCAYASRAAERLRDARQEAAGVCLFVQYMIPELDVHADGQFNAAHVVFPHPTANTSEFRTLIVPTVPTLFRQGMRHRKCGVICFGLENALVRQLELFSDGAPPPPVPDTLYGTLDGINRRFGRDTVFTAAQGMTQPWAMQRQRLSRRFTTSWEELLPVC